MHTLSKTAALALVSAAIAGSVFVAPAAEAKPKWKKNFNVSIVLGTPYYGGFYVRTGRPCRWLKRKAINTGSGYWWSRYHECRAYHY